MEVKLEQKDALWVVFGLPVLGAVILLAAVLVGHVISHSNPPTPITVQASTPKVDIHVPQAAPPKVEVTATAAQPTVEVNIPASNPPPVNITAPQPLVVFRDRPEPTPELKREVPVKAHSEVLVPVEVKPIPKPDKPIEVSFKPEELTLDTLYQYAERYINSYCAAKHLDPTAETARWNKEWRQKLETAITDGSVNDEQGYMNRVIVEKRDCLDLERATPEKIVEGCRLMLRYRDGKLTLLQAMKDQVTGENLRKGLAFLAAGVK